MRNVITGLLAALTGTAILAAEVLRARKARARADVWSHLSDSL